MALKLLAFMVAVAVLGGVAGFSDEQLVNENQINVHGNSSLSEDNLDRQKRAMLTKRACSILGGTCQKIGTHCQGETKRGVQYCMEYRRYECCCEPPEDIPCDCVIGWKVYRHGACALDWCIELRCDNGVWVYKGWNPLCGICNTYGRTNILTYNRNGTTSYRFPYGKDPCTFAFSQYGRSEVSPFGIATTFESYSHEETYITYVAYCELGMTVELYFYPFTDYPVEIYVNSQSFVFTSCYNTVVPIFGGSFGTVFLICDMKYTKEYGTITIVGSRGLSVCVNYDYYYNHPYNVFAMATTSLQNEIFGLCNTYTNVYSYPTTYTMSSGAVTTSTTAFVESWEYKSEERMRTLRNKLHKNPSKSHTNQVTDQPIVERSMKERRKACKDMNKEPCTVLSSEACQNLIKACVSTMLYLSKHGHRRLQRFNESSSD